MGRKTIGYPIVNGVKIGSHLIYPCPTTERMMMSDALSKINFKSTPQTEKAREDQIKNSAGGYVFQVDDMSRLDRFLMLGVDGGTYYVQEKELALGSAEFLKNLAATNGVQMVQRIKEISLAGRAPRQKATLFALAIASVFGDKDTRSAAYDALPAIARTGTMLFNFIQYRENMGGWSAGLRRAVSKWYNGKSVDKLAYQLLKYRQRDGWTHKDTLRLGHVKPISPQHDALYSITVGKGLTQDKGDLPQIYTVFDALQDPSTSVGEAADLIQSSAGAVSWEMLPDRLMNEHLIWEAMFDQGIPQHALIRQLPRLTRMGLIFDTDSGYTNRIVKQLTDAHKLKQARVHPINLLIAQKTYASGHGKGSNIWQPSRKIINALDEAFYLAFDAVEPTEKRLMLAVDVSGSMDWQTVGGFNMTPRTAAAAMSLVTERTEPNVTITGFSNQLIGLNISSRQRLDDVEKYMANIPMGDTDIALPIQYATQKKLSVDAFIVYTDNETWAGRTHPYQALKQYRDTMGIDAKLITVAFTATNFTIADPRDFGMLDVVGFDSAVPNVISEFIKGHESQDN